jgi:hypothetical protein
MKKCVHDLCHLYANESAMADDALRLQEALANLLIALGKKNPDLIEAGILDARCALVRMDKEAA